MNGLALNGLPMDGLAVRGLTVTGPDGPLVRDVALDIPPGRILALAGRSGSGKSLTAAAILGVGALPAAGDVRLDGRPLPPPGPGRGTALIQQQPRRALNPIRSIGRQVADAGGTDVAALLARVRFPPGRAGAVAHQLSGGLCQRAAIAVALAGRPRLLVADEPTTDLDTVAQAAVLDLIRAIARDEGLAVLLITHDLAVAARWSDRVAVMAAGRIVEEGPARAVLAAPRMAETAALIAARAAPAPPPGRIGPMDGEAPAFARGGRPLEGEIAPPATVERPLAGETPMGVVPPLGEGSLPPTAGAAPPPIASEPPPGEVMSRRLPPPDGEVLLRAEGLVRGFSPGLFARRIPAVAGAGVMLHAGEAVALVGASGSGKTTLARLIARLEMPEAGWIELMGVRVAAPPAAFAHAPERRLVQIAFQDATGALDPRRTARESIREPLLTLCPDAATEARIQEAAVRAGLDPALLDRRPAALSGGQRARVGLARALAPRPRILILDEPTSALDAPLAAALVRRLDRLRRDAAMAILIVTHDLGLVEAFCDRVMVMEAGRIVEEGATARILAAPQAGATRALIAARP